MGDVTEHGQLRWDKDRNGQERQEVQYIVAWSLGNDQSILNGYITSSLNGDRARIAPVVRLVSSTTGLFISNILESGYVTLDIAVGTKLKDSSTTYKKYHVAVVGGYGRPAGITSTLYPIADVYITALPNTPPTAKKPIAELDTFSQPVTVSFDLAVDSTLSDVEVCAWRKDAKGKYAWRRLSKNEVESNGNNVTITTTQLGHFTILHKTEPAIMATRRESTVPFLDGALIAAEAAARAAKAAAEAAEAAISAVRRSSGPYA